jgi:Fe-S cluster assembly protein SufD
MAGSKRRWGAEMPQPLDSYITEWERTRELRKIDGRLTHIREEALHRFLSVGFPTTHDEEWRFTSVAPIVERTFRVASSVTDVSDIEVSRFRLPIATAAELVFVNGRYAPAVSRTAMLPAPSRVDTLASLRSIHVEEIESHLGRIAQFERHPFVALNTAFLDDGAVVQVPAGTVVNGPIHLLFLTTGAIDGQRLIAHPRVLMILGENSQASVVETYAGPGGAQYFTNAVTEIVLGQNAVLDHYKLQYEGAESYHVGATFVLTSRNATCASHSISIGGALVRNDVVAVLNGEGVECTLNGLYAADAQRLVDNHTTIDHARPHCGSREVYKGVLAERARGVFNGKIIVRPDAQKTDAKQTNRALLLSEDAQINTKPQLEIFANDVKCTHGAAVGQLDDDALFYLRSRGLSEAVARRILIHAFAADVLNRLPLVPVRVEIESRLQRQLARALPSAA